MNVAEQVRQILADQALLDVSEVSLDASLDDIGIDSMGVVESIFVIEETFDVQVPFNANDPSAGDFDISSVSAIIKAVEQLVASKNDQ